MEKRKGLFIEKLYAKIKKYNIVGSKLVPMEISLSKYLEINRYEQQLSKKEIEKKALILAEKKVREGLKKDELQYNKREISWTRKLINLARKKEKQEFIDTKIRVCNYRLFVKTYLL